MDHFKGVRPMLALACQHPRDPATDGGDADLRGEHVSRPPDPRQPDLPASFYTASTPSRHSLLWNPPARGTLPLK